MIAGLRHPELESDRPEELPRRKAGVQDHPHLVALPHPVHQGPGQQRLARAHLSGEERELHLLDREQQPLEGLLVGLVQEQVAWIGRLPEGLLA